MPDGILILGTSDHSTLIPPEAAASKDGDVIQHDGFSGRDAAQKATVATPHPVWLSMKRRWALIDALMAGTLTMRAWGQEFLPREEKESDDGYANRLRRTFLFNGLESAIRSIVSKPFSRDVAVKEDDSLDERVQDWVDDTDGKGTHLTGFLSKLFEVANRYGLGHTLTDMPPLPAESTAATDRERIPRSFVISPQDLFNWAFAEDGELERIHVRETHEVKVGQYGSTFVTRVRVYWRDRWELWEQQKKSNNAETTYTMVDGGPLTGHDGKPLKRIPLRTYYVSGHKLAEMVASIPHQGLADHNLDHWQTYSDYANIVHFASVPLLFAKGFSEDEQKNTTVASVTSVIPTENEEADLKYVEITGQSIASARDKLRDLEEAMRQKGMEPFMPNRSGDVKATEIAVTESKSQSKVQRWITDLQDTAFKVLEDVHTWLGLEVPAEVTVDIFQDFSPVGALDDLDDLSKMQLSGQLSLRTLLHETRRRGRISEATDIEEEIKEIEREKMDDAPDPMPNDPPADGEIVVDGNPWRIEKRNGKFAVVKVADGSVAGTHDTQAEAVAQLAALEANEDED